MSHACIASGTYDPGTEVGVGMTSARIGATAGPPAESAGGYAAELERATRGLLEINVALLEQIEKKIGLAPLRALQALERLGPTMVTELGNDLDMVVSTASRLSDRLAEAGFITRRVSPANRRATLLELTDAGRDVLAELISIRTGAMAVVADRMTAADRRALLRGGRAFTAVQQGFADSAPRPPDEGPDTGGPHVPG